MPIRLTQTPTRASVCLNRIGGRFYPFNAFRSLLGIAASVQAPTYIPALGPTLYPPYM